MFYIKDTLSVTWGQVLAGAGKETDDAGVISEEEWGAGGGGGGGKGMGTGGRRGGGGGAGAPFFSIFSPATLPIVFTTKRTHFPMNGLL